MEKKIKTKTKKKKKTLKIMTNLYREIRNETMKHEKDSIKKVKEQKSSENEKYTKIKIIP